MAAVSIPPSPQVLTAMTSRRVPLASVPNATNSPFRATAAAGGKRQRSHAGEQRDLAYGQPPSKRQIVEGEGEDPRRFTIPRKTGNHVPNAFQRKLEAARENRPVQKTSERSQKATENLETIRQWQRHYRKAFPQFVFYFESLNEDARAKASRQVTTLGARVEKFFSKAVTHVVTTRPIPPETDVTASHETRASASVAPVQEHKGQYRTIDPSLLEQNGRSNAALQKRLHGLIPSNLQDGESRRQHSGDILYKAREMGMKIWALEKLTRMMNTMFSADTGEQITQHQNAHGTGAGVASLRAGRDHDLSTLLKNEKLNGPADRDLTVATQEMVPFRGYYIYIHDMDEKTRPVMVRDYPKPASKEDGKWPQFRMSGPGKCPFIDDHSYTKRAAAQYEEKKADVKNTTTTRTRTATSLETSKQRTIPEVSGKRVLGENNNVSARSTSVDQAGDSHDSKPLDPPKLIPAKRGNPDSALPLFGSAQASLRSLPRFAGGEPVASGVQPSNITSAIRSQMISSTAAAPNARAGTSKEVHQLKRKVLEKNSAPSANSMPSSYLNDLRAGINQDRVDRALPARAAKRKAQENLGYIHEDSEDEDRPRKEPVVRKKVVEKELKPGYCENCREKFNDFDEHIMSRKHRKFALTPDNWSELDSLLKQLERPLKETFF